MASLKKQVADLYSAFDSAKDEFCVDMESEAPDGRPVWKWMGYSTKGNATRSLGKLIEGVDYQLSEVITAAGGTPRRVIRFSLDGLKRWGMSSGTARGRKIQDYFLECERRATQGRKPWSKPLELTLEGAQIIDARTKSNKSLGAMAKQQKDLPCYKAHQVRNEEFWVESTDSLKERAGIRSGSWHKKADLNTQMLTWYVNQKILKEAEAKNNDGMSMDADDVGVVCRTVRACLEPIEGKDFRAGFMPKSISEQRAARMLEAAKEVNQKTLF